MSTGVKTEWQISGEEVGSCNCDWGCPCQFNAPPTTDHCEALIGYIIRSGHYGDTSLDGVRFAGIYSWPGRIDEGNGTRQIIVDEGVTAEQRRAIDALVSGTEGGAYFEIFAAVAPNQFDTLKAPIDIQSGPDETRITVGKIGVAVAKPLRGATGELTRLLHGAAAFRDNIGLANGKGTSWRDPDMRQWDSMGHAEITEFDWSA